MRERGGRPKLEESFVYISSLKNGRIEMAEGGRTRGGEYFVSCGYGHQGIPYTPRSHHPRVPEDNVTIHIDMYRLK
jgi:hypothetical protein